MSVPADGSRENQKGFYIRWTVQFGGPSVTVLRTFELVVSLSDPNAIVSEAIAHGIEPVISPRSHRKVPRYYDQDLYRLRHMVENAFLNFKQWRAVATCYAKRAASFLAMCLIRALVLWTRLF